MALTQITTNGIKDGTITGTDLATNVDLVDNQKLRLGTGNDLSLYHDSSNSYVNNTTGTLFYLANTHYFANPALSEIQATFVKNGAVSLYYDNSKKFESSSDGVIFTGAARFVGNETGFLTGKAHPTLYRTASTSGSYPFDNFGHLIIQSRNDGANRDIIFATGTNSAKLNRITSDGHLDLFGDNQKLRLGAGNDAELFWDGSGTRFSAGALLNLRADIHTLTNAANSETMLKCTANGAVELNFDAAKKFETKTFGVQIQGSAYTDNGDFHVADNGKLKAGNSSDLSLYHDGSNSFIKDGGGSTGLVIQAPLLAVKNAAGSENMIVATENGNVELMYDNSKKFETTSTGTVTTGVLAVNDATSADAGNRISVGTSQDIRIYHIAGNDSYFRNYTGDTYLQGNNSGTVVNNIKFENSNGATELYFNSNKKFETTSTGVALSGNLELSGPGGNVSTNWDNAAWEKVIFDASYNTNPQGPNKIVLQNDTGWKAGFGISTNEVGMYSGGSINFYSKTTDSTASTKENLAKFISDGAVELYYDNAKKFETLSGGVQVTGNLAFGTNNCQIQTGSSGNTLAIQGGATNMGGRIEFRGGNSDGDIRMFAQGATSTKVERLRINSSGVTITADVLPEANNSRNLGSTSLRWANVYTNDLNLSNEGGSNDVDGTWGSYTIQEGAEDLFLVNKRSGKKYKFNLTEVL